MSKKRKQLYAVFIGYFVILLGLTISPVSIAYWNRLEPHIFGLPFAQFMVILFSLLLIIGLLIWFVLEGKLNEKERVMRERG